MRTQMAGLCVAACVLSRMVFATNLEDGNSEEWFEDLVNLDLGSEFNPDPEAIDESVSAGEPVINHSHKAAHSMELDDQPERGEHNTSQMMDPGDRMVRSVRANYFFSVAHEPESHKVYREFLPDDREQHREDQRDSHEQDEDEDGNAQPGVQRYLSSLNTDSVEDTSVQEFPSQFNRGSDPDASGLKRTSFYSLHSRPKSDVADKKVVYKSRGKEPNPPNFTFNVHARHEPYLSAVPSVGVNQSPVQASSYLGTDSGSPGRFGKQDQYKTYESNEEGGGNERVNGALYTQERNHNLNRYQNMQPHSLFLKPLEAVNRSLSSDSKSFGTPKAALNSGLENRARQDVHSDDYIGERQMVNGGFHDDQPQNYNVPSSNNGEVGFQHYPSFLVSVLPANNSRLHDSPANSNVGLPKAFDASVNDQPREDNDEVNEEGLQHYQPNRQLGTRLYPSYLTPFIGVNQSSIYSQSDMDKEPEERQDQESRQDSNENYQDGSNQAQVQDAEDHDQHQNDSQSITNPFSSILIPLIGVNHSSHQPNSSYLKSKSVSIPRPQEQQRYRPRQRESENGWVLENPRTQGIIEIPRDDKEQQSDRRPLPNYRTIIIPLIGVNRSLGNGQYFISNPKFIEEAQKIVAGSNGQARGNVGSDIGRRAEIQEVLNNVRDRVSHYSPLLVPLVGLNQSFIQRHSSSDPQRVESSEHTGEINDDDDYFSEENCEDEKRTDDPRQYPHNVAQPTIQPYTQYLIPLIGVNHSSHQSYPSFADARTKSVEFPDEDFSLDDGVPYGNVEIDKPNERVQKAQQGLDVTEEHPNIGQILLPRYSPIIIPLIGANQSLVDVKAITDAVKKAKEQVNAYQIPGDQSRRGNSAYKNNVDQNFQVQERGAHEQAEKTNDRSADDHYSPLLIPLIGLNQSSFQPNSSYLSKLNPNGVDKSGKRNIPDAVEEFQPVDVVDKNAHREQNNLKKHLANVQEVLQRYSPYLIPLLGFNHSEIQENSAQSSPNSYQKSEELSIEPGFPFKEYRDGHDKPNIPGTIDEEHFNSNSQVTSRPAIQFYSQFLLPGSNGYGHSIKDNSHHQERADEESGNHGPRISYDKDINENNHQVRNQSPFQPYSHYLTPIAGVNQSYGQTQPIHNPPSSQEHQFLRALHDFNSHENTDPVVENEDSHQQYVENFRRSGHRTKPTTQPYGNSLSILNTAYPVSASNNSFGQPNSLFLKTTANTVAGLHEQVVDVDIQSRERKNQEVKNNDSVTYYQENFTVDRNPIAHHPPVQLYAVNQYPPLKEEHSQVQANYSYFQPNTLRLDEQGNVPGDPHVPEYGDKYRHDKYRADHPVYGGQYSKENDPSDGQSPIERYSSYRLPLSRPITSYNSSKRSLLDKLGKSSPSDIHNSFEDAKDVNADGIRKISVEEYEMTKRKKYNHGGDEPTYISYSPYLSEINNSEAQSEDAFLKPLPSSITEVGVRGTLYDLPQLNFDADEEKGTYDPLVERIPIRRNKHQRLAQHRQMLPPYSPRLVPLYNISQSTGSNNFNLSAEIPSPYPHLVPLINVDRGSIGSSGSSTAPNGGSAEYGTQKPRANFLLQQKDDSSLENNDGGVLRANYDSLKHWINQNQKSSPVIQSLSAILIPLGSINRTIIQPNSSLQKVNSDAFNRSLEYSTYHNNTKYNDKSKVGSNEDDRPPVPRKYRTNVLNPDIEKGQENQHHSFRPTTHDDTISTEERATPSHSTSVPLFANYESKLLHERSEGILNDNFERQQLANYTSHPHQSSEHSQSQTTSSPSFIINDLNSGFGKAEYKDKNGYAHQPTGNKSFLHSLSGFALQHSTSIPLIQHPTSAPSLQHPTPRLAGNGYNSNLWTKKSDEAGDDKNTHRLSLNTQDDDSGERFFTNEWLKEFDIGPSSALKVQDKEHAGDKVMDEEFGLKMKPKSLSWVREVTSHAHQDEEKRSDVKGGPEMKKTDKEGSFEKFDTYSEFHWKPEDHGEIKNEPHKHLRSKNRDHHKKLNHADFRDLQVSLEDFGDHANYGHFDSHHDDHRSGLHGLDDHADIVSHDSDGLRGNTEHNKPSDITEHHNDHYGSLNHDHADILQDHDHHNDDGPTIGEEDSGDDHFGHDYKLDSDHSSEEHYEDHDHGNVDDAHERSHFHLGGEAQRDHHDVNSVSGDFYESGNGHKGGHHEGSTDKKSGTKTTGYHNVLHKDEYTRDHTFYDNAYRGGHYVKDGELQKHFDSSDGDHKNGQNHQSGFDSNHSGKKDHHDIGHSDSDHKGHTNREHFFSHHDDETKYGGKKNRNGGKESGFSKEPSTDQL